MRCIKHECGFLRMNEILFDGADEIEEMMRDEAAVALFEKMEKANER